MTTILASIPDFPARVAADAAEKEQTTADQIVAAALSLQLSAWWVRNSVEQRVRRGNISDLDDILAAVPDAPLVPGDER